MEGIGVQRTSGKPSLEGKVEDPRPNQDGVLAFVDLPVSKHPSLQVADLKDLEFSGGNLERSLQVSARMLDAGGEAPARGGASTARLGASHRSPRPILGHLADAANLLSLAGLLCSAVAVAFALNGRFSEAGICLVLAFLADVYDGPVAKLLKNRTDTDRAFGANLDSLIDIVTSGVLPGVILLSAGGFGGWYVPGAFLILAAAALRLSHFNVNGLGSTASHYTGLPTDLVILAFAALMLLDAPLERELFCAILYGGVVALSSLMVSPLKVRKLEGGWYYGQTLIAVVIGVGHLAGALA